MPSRTNSLGIILTIFFGAFLIAGSIFYNQRTAPSSSATPPAVSSPIASSDTSNTTIEKDGETYVVAKDEPMTLTIVTDSSCANCQTSDLLNWLKGQLGKPLAVRELEYTSPEGKEVLETYGGEYLPFLLLGDELSTHPNFAHLTHHIVTQTGDKYLVDLQKMGAPVGKYLDVASYAADDATAPKITLEKTEENLGVIHLPDGIKETEFTITNDGENPLVFLGLNTSCGCTSAKVVTPSEESPAYLMAGHAEPVKWRGELQPGETGKIVVSYDPSVHPDLQGDVMREVYISTNDPNTPQATLRIFVNQQPE